MEAQSGLYIKPDAGVVWNTYENTNAYITGNDIYGNLFWDVDFIGGLLVGYDFKNKIGLESGLIYHSAINRYSVNLLGRFSGFGIAASGIEEGYLIIPLNLKYNFDTGVSRLKVVPYAGAALSTHFLPEGSYSQLSSSLGGFSPFQGTTAFATAEAYRPTRVNILLNVGFGLEYTFYKNIAFTLNWNFTKGFSDFNVIDVELDNSGQIEHGEIIYHGDKFYMSGGFKIPLINHYTDSHKQNHRKEHDETVNHHTGKSF